MAQASLLDIRDIHTWFDTPGGTVRAVDGVSISLSAGEILGLVGGSGSGKTTLAQSILRLVSSPGRIVSGEVWFNGQNLMTLPDYAMCRVRGRQIALILQDALTSLHPVFPIGRQVAAVIARCHGYKGPEAERMAGQMLRLMGLEPKEWAGQRVHQLSGGMRQRVMLAMALACEPAVLLADEPTTGLDVTLQVEVLNLLSRRCVDQGMAMLLITHNLGTLAETAERVAVMESGQVVEEAPTLLLLKEPKHPFSVALVSAAMRLVGQMGAEEKIWEPRVNTVRPPGGCVYVDRCPYAFTRCQTERPQLREVAAGWRVACFLHHDVGVSEVSRQPTTTPKGDEG